MIHSGLVSITFRKLSPRQVVDLIVQAGLDAIEWGGDVHAPHGDVAKAQEVAQMTADAGLAMPTYGSYYRVGHRADVPFSDVLVSAVTLGTPAIRVWAGKVGSAEADAAYWNAVIADSQRIVDLAATEGIAIAYEFHGNTLTDSAESARRLLEAVDRPTLRSLWQPPKGATVEENRAGIDTIAPWLSHIHAFSWRMEEGQTIRLPLADYTNAWKEYLARIDALGGERYVLLEFVRNDDPAQFLADATTLRGWLSGDG
ncbi:MAG: TIM barrel protein [Caldilineaceae bacterium]|nr:TIM barrel protein [Caldilineaceae bacterium]